MKGIFSEIISMSAAAATAYGYLTGNHNFINIGIAIAWVYISLAFIVAFISIGVLSAGDAEARRKLKEAFKKNNTARQVWNTLKLATLTAFLALSGAIVTAVVTVIIAVLLSVTRHSLNEK